MVKVAANEREVFREPEADSLRIYFLHCKDRSEKLWCISNYTKIFYLLKHSSCYVQPLQSHIFLFKELASKAYCLKK